MNKRERRLKSDPLSRKAFNKKKAVTVHMKVKGTLRRSLRFKNKQAIQLAHLSQRIQMALCEKYLKPLDPHQQHLDTVTCHYCKRDPQNMQTSLLLCDYCVSGASHCGCVYPPYTSVPEGKFGCPQCVDKVMTEHKEEYNAIIQQRMPHSRSLSMSMSISNGGDHDEINKKINIKSDVNNKSQSKTQPECNSSDSIHSTEALKERRENIVEQIMRRNSEFMEQFESETTFMSIDQYKEDIDLLQENANRLHQQMTTSSQNEMDSLHREIKEIRKKMKESHECIESTSRHLQFHQERVKHFENTLTTLQSTHSVLRKQMQGKRKDIESVKAVQEQQRQISTEFIKEITDRVLDEALERIEKRHCLWTTDDVISWLNLIGFSDTKFNPLHCAVSKTGICGDTLRDINRSFLKVVGLEEEDRKRLMQCMQRLRENANGENASNHICTICAENEINSVFYPCGHQVLCYQCSQTHQIPKCPVCCQSVSQTIQTFICGF